MTNQNKFTSWHELTKIIEDINLLLEKENKYLETADLASLKAMQTEKIQLVERYETIFLQIKKQVAENGLSEEERAELSKLNFNDIATKLHTVCSHNIVFIQAQQETQDFMMNEIVQSAKKQKSVTGYNTKCEMHHTNNEDMPLVVNEKI